MTLKSILELSAKATLSDCVTATRRSPIGNTSAAASGAGEVYLLNKGIGASLCEPTGQSIDDLAFSFDGEWLATGGQAGTITLWQMDGDAPKIADTLECCSWVDRLVVALCWIWQATQEWVACLAFGRRLDHPLASSTGGGAGA